MFCCTLLYVHSSIAIILMGKRELIALLNLSSWCLVMVERLFLAVPRGCLQFVIVVFPDHTHSLFFITSHRYAFVHSLHCVTVGLHRLTNHRYTRVHCWTMQRLTSTHTLASEPSLVCLVAHQNIHDLSIFGACISISL